MPLQASLTVGLERPFSEWNLPFPTSAKLLKLATISYLHCMISSARTASDSPDSGLAVLARRCKDEIPRVIAVALSTKRTPQRAESPAAGKALPIPSLHEGADDC